MTASTLLKRLLLGISPTQASFARRSFRAGSPATRRHLERVGRTFLDGYNLALEDDEPRALGGRLDEHPAALRGFAFEGAAMALALLDLLTPWRRDRHATFRASAGRDHVYMVYVGAGWALARLRASITRYVVEGDPLLGWLAADGYGFHEGYFHPRRSFARQLRPRAAAGHAGQVFDQGLGRSLWFVECADAPRIAAAIARFEPDRRADLWSGVGLACAYAGGVRESVVRALSLAAGHYGADVAQGAAFAAAARAHAGNPTAHTELACSLLCGMSAVEAATLTDAARLDLPPDGARPAYAEWRRRLRDSFAPLVTSGAGAIR